MGHLCGVVKDGAAWNKDHALRNSTEAWFMSAGSGALWGNGKQGSDIAGEINSGQTLSIEADLDSGTLRFWVDGQPYGPGCTSGVTGRLRFAVSLCYTDRSVQIVPTPELQAWTE